MAGDQETRVGLYKLNKVSGSIMIFFLNFFFYIHISDFIFIFSDICLHLENMGIWKIYTIWACKIYKEIFSEINNIRKVKNLI